MIVSLTTKGETNMQDKLINLSCVNKHLPLPYHYLQRFFPFFALKFLDFVVSSSAGICMGNVTSNFQ